MRRVLAVAISVSHRSPPRTGPTPARSGIRLAAASQALAAGKLDDAERHLTQVAALGRDIRVEILRGELLVAKKDAAGAAGLLEAAIRTLKPTGELARAAHRSHAPRARRARPIRRRRARDPESRSGSTRPRASSLALAARGLAELGDRRARPERCCASPSTWTRSGRTCWRRARSWRSRTATRPPRCATPRRCVARRPPTGRPASCAARALHAAGRRRGARCSAVLDRAAPLDPPPPPRARRSRPRGGSIDEAEAALRRLGPSRGPMRRRSRAPGSIAASRGGRSVFSTPSDSGTIALLRLRASRALEMLDGDSRAPRPRADSRAGDGGQLARAGRAPRRRAGGRRADPGTSPRARRPLFTPRAWS